jgi:prepilin-type N-terminal cleavage/methylation domain-containing protein
MIGRKGFTLAELLIALTVLGVIASFTLPKVLTQMQQSTMRAVGKETIAAVNAALYEGWLKGDININSNTTQVASYLAQKLNVVRHCLPSRPSDDCTTAHLHFGNGRNIFVLHNGAWVSLEVSNAGSPSISMFIDANGAEAPNVDPNVGGTATTSDIAMVVFNKSQQEANVTNVSTNFKPGQLLPNRFNGRHLVYEYWFQG